MNEKNSFHGPAGFIIGGIVIVLVGGLMGLGLLVSGGNNSSVGKDSSVGSNVESIIVGEEAVVGKEAEGVEESGEDTGEPDLPSPSPSFRVVSEEEQKFKEDFFDMTQKYLQEWGSDRLVASWDDGDNVFVYEFQPNGDIFFQVKATDAEGEAQERELFCLGKQGERECWTRDTRVVEGGDVWWRLDEPSLTVVWEFPAGVETESSPEWFLARGLSSVNCTAAQAETLFEHGEGSKNFVVENTIDMQEDDGRKYLGDHKTSIVFDEGGVFGLVGIVRDQEDSVVKSELRLDMRPAGEGDRFEQYYPTMQERVEAKKMPALPLPTPSIMSSPSVEGNEDSSRS